MNGRPLTLMEILKPSRIRPNAQRDRVTRTVIQPDIDRFEQSRPEHGDADAAPFAIPGLRGSDSRPACHTE